jgi:hypothetical protein
MKSFGWLIALSLTIQCHGVLAQSTTGRYYGPNGQYVKCTTYASGNDVSTFCKSGKEARDEDLRLDRKNQCMDKVNAAHIKKWGTYNARRGMSEPLLEPIGIFEPEFYIDVLEQPEGANLKAYSEYQAASKKCFSKNGF